MICVFDCETIPDVELLSRVYGYQGDFLSVCEQAFAQAKEQSGSEFLPHCFHKVITIAALIAQPNGMMLRLGCFEAGKSEREIIEAFLTYLQKQPRLVSFNGRGFDMPMLLLRAMRYNLQAGAYFETKNPAVGKDKWENYRQRFSERFHLDLFDSLGHFGAATRGLKLHNIASACQLPGKFDTQGDEVYRLYADGKMGAIDAYCESDVLNTYWLFLKWQLLCGQFELAHYRACLQNLQQQIPEQKPYTAAFMEAIQAELARSE
ncbi:MAG: 3'-5' exonuclease [Helicobacter sp.]|nr:3'-5' exonuclease [Helicobacter sp.]